MNNYYLTIIITKQIVIFQTTGGVYIDNLPVNNLSDKELAGLRLK